MVIIILGSKSDLSWGKEIGNNLTNFGIEYKIRIASAHKTPDSLLNLIRNNEKSDKQVVYICVAGRSNALGGFVDANTVHPVINCPPPSEKFGGMDILSSLRMPSGVASVTVLEPDQAALAAAKILASADNKLKIKINDYHKKMKSKIDSEDKLAAKNLASRRFSENN